MKKVLGIGSALVDINILIDNDEILEKLSLPKGSMQLVDSQRSSNVLKETQHFDRILASGGSAANTIDGLAHLGVPTSFIGKIKKDEMGDVFKNDLIKANVTPYLSYSDIASGTAATLISQDTERTFATHLGAAVELCPDDLIDAYYSNHDYFYIEGYLVHNHRLIEAAVKKAKENNLKVFLDLASYNVVEENLEFLKHIVKNYVDVIFANEEESKAFTGKEPEEALNELAEYAEIVIVKIGKKGSLIKSKGKTYKVKTIGTKPIDTNGAGDQYAAGFIYGLSNNYDLEKCGKIASITSGKVIENLGARIKPEVWPEVKAMIAKI